MILMFKKINIYSMLLRVIDIREENASYRNKKPKPRVQTG